MKDIDDELNRFIAGFRGSFPTGAISVVKLKDPYMIEFRAGIQVTMSVDSGMIYQSGLEPIIDSIVDAFQQRAVETFHLDTYESRKRAEAEKALEAANKKIANLTRQRDQLIDAVPPLAEKRIMETSRER